MQEVILSILFFFHEVGGWFDSGNQPEEALRSYGGIATVELTVKDDQGSPVEGAEAKVWFWLPTNEDSSDAGKTDIQGRVTLSGEARLDGNVSVSKDGYYDTDMHIKLTAPEEPFGFFGRRRWKSVMREVILPKIRNPIPMYAYIGMSLPFPKGQNKVGLDLRKFDWMPPFGEGEHLDVLVSITTQEEWNGKLMWRVAETLTFYFPNPGDGMQLHEKVSSQFPTTHHVNSKQPFLQSMTFSQVNARYMVDGRHYLTFRVRTEYNADGTIKRAHYGKIHGVVEMGNNLYLYVQAVYFNPRPNDTNLEFDPKRNLVPEKELRRRRVLRP